MSTPRCLVIFEEPLRPDRGCTAQSPVPDIVGAQSLHRLAQGGCSTLIAYRGDPHGHPPSPADALSQLLGMHRALKDDRPPEDRQSASYLQVRYTDLQAGCISDSTDACLLAKQAGLDVLPFQDLDITVSNSVETRHPQAPLLAGRLMAFLGFDSSTDPAKSQHKSFDMLLVYLTQQSINKQSQKGHAWIHAQTESQHTAAAETTLSEAPCDSSSLYCWMDQLVDCLLQQPAAQTQLLLVVVLSNLPGNAAECLREQEAVHEELGFPPVRRPVQSHCLSNMQRLALHHSQASLMVQHLPGTVRQDGVSKCSVSEAKVSGGGVCILAEHILPELAYKIGKAPKYGA